MAAGDALDLARGTHRLIVRTLVLKAGKLTDPAYSVPVKALGDFLSSGFDQAARPVVSAALAELEAGIVGGKDPTQLADELEASVSAALGALGHDEAAAAGPVIGKVLGAVYRLGMEEGTVKGLGRPVGTIEGAFNVADGDALAGLQRLGTLWIGESYGDGAFDLAGLKAHVEAALRSGQGRDATGEQLRALLGGQFQRSDSYWRGLAATVATRARSFGALSSLHAQGFRRYKYINPMDERTSDLCLHLDGKTFEVSAALRQRDELLAATSPQAWKAIAPWPRKGDWHDDEGAALDAGALQARGIMLPPLHFHCRSSIQLVLEDLDDTPLPELPSGYEGVPLPEYPPDPEPEPQGPIPGVFPHALDALTVPKQEHLSGAHSKVIVTAADGSRWLVKPYSHHVATDAFRARADVFAADLAHLLDVPAADAYRIELPAGHPALRAMGMNGGRPVVASIQRFSDDVQGPIGSAALKDLTKDQLFAVQREHVFDWLISNHDGHGENILHLADGSLLGIDKGQAFRFFGKDRLDWDYNPNEGYGQFGYMNLEARRYAAGEYGAKFTLKGPGKGNQRLAAFLEQIRDLPDADFLAVVRPYVEEASANGVRWNGMGQAEFEAALLARKNGIVEEVGGFYRRLEKARKAALPPPKAKAIVPLDKAFAASVDRTGWEGRSLYVSDSKRVRSGNVLVYGMDGDGTILEAYVTREGEAAISAAVGGGQSVVQAGAVAQATDQHVGPLVTALKHFKYHLTDGASDGVISPVQLAKVYDEFTDLAQLTTLEGQAMAEHYAAFWGPALGKPGASASDIVDLLQEAQSPAHVAALLKEHLPQGGVLNGWAPPAPLAPKPVNTGGAGYKVVQSPIREWDARIQPGGRVKFLGEAGEAFSNGKQWEITTPEGIRVIYVPHAGNEIPASFAATDGATRAQSSGKVGRLRVLLPGPASNLTPAQIQAGLDQLKRLGLGVDLATPEDAELAYLRKVTYCAKLEDEQAFRTTAKTVKGQVEQLRKAWGAELDVADVRKIPSYGVLPAHNEGAGWGHWTRFDVAPNVVEEFRLSHDLSGDSALSFFQTALPAARSLVSTETRCRIGIPIRGAGLSAVEDMWSGGSTGVFTRVVPNGEALRAKMIHIRAEVMLDADNRVFGFDAYHVHDNPTVRASGKMLHQLTGPDLRAIAQVSSNETATWQAVGFDKIDRIGVADAAERDALLALFRAQGVTSLGGKPVDQIVEIAASRY